MKEQVKKTIWLLCINDLHAEMEESEDVPGCGKLVTAIQEFRKKHNNTIVLFGGDNYKGDPASEYLHGKPVTEMMRMLDVKASVLGNHEFDFGVERIRRWQLEGGYLFLAANMIDVSSGKLPDFVNSSVTVEAAGIKILIIGLALAERLATVDRPQEMENYAILGEDQIGAVIAEAKSKADQDVCAVIALTHYGLRYQSDSHEPVGDEVISLCERIPGIDGVFAAHLHRFMALRINGVAVSQGGGRGQGFAWIRLDFDHENRLLSAEPGYEDLREQKKNLEPNPYMQEIWEKSKGYAMTNLGRTIAVLKGPVFHRDPKTFEVNPKGSLLSALATKLMRQATSCPIALLYSGRIGTGFPAGELTLYQVYQNIFFRIGIMTMCLLGKEIRDNIEIGLRTLSGEGASPIAVGGLLVKADFSKPYGHRVETIMLEDGRLFDEDEEYSVAVDDYLAENPLGFHFESAKQVVNTGISVRELMIEEIARKGNI